MTLTRALREMERELSGRIGAARFGGVPARYWRTGRSDAWRHMQDLRRAMNEERELDEALVARTLQSLHAQLGQADRDEMGYASLLVEAPRTLTLSLWQATKRRS